MLEKFKTLHWFIRFILILISMIITIWFLVAAFPRVLPTANLSSTSKWGIILSNEHWSGEIKIVGDIWALPGTTVTIDPGTKITVASSGDKFNQHYLPWGLKSGLNTGGDWFGVKNGELFWDESEKIQIRLSRVIALGTKEQPIIFTSDHDSLNPYDFNVISAVSGVFDHVHASNYRRFLLGNGVIVVNSVFKSAGECSLCAEYTSPTISNNIFEGSLRSHILVIGGDPKISDNLFSQGSPVGIEIDPQNWAKPLIYNNDFEMDSKIAIKLTAGDEDKGGVISSNTFSGGSILEIPCNSNISIVQNQIRGRLKLASLGNCIGEIVIGPNFWGSSDSDVILNEKIVGRESGFNVLIPQILDRPPVSGRRIN